MNQELKIFSSESSFFELYGVRALRRALQYDPNNKESFLSGLLLADHLESEQDVVLYTAGTPITYERVTRLINLSESNPNLDLHFTLERSSELVDNFRKEIRSKIKNLVSFRKNYKVYSSMLIEIEDELNAYIDEILSEDNITLELYKLKYITENAEVSDSKKFFNHAASTALFSFAITKSEPIRSKIDFSTEDEINLIKAAFFHNIGAIIEVESIMNAKLDYRKKIYYDECRNSNEYLQSIELEEDILKAIRLYSGYYFGKTDYLSDEESSSSWIANLITVSDQYVLSEIGLFGEKKKPSAIIDQINALAHNKLLNESVVKAITSGLGMKQIADFYAQIEKIGEECNFDGGDHAWAYPIKGFKSPTLFVCMNNQDKCEYYEHTSKSVSLMQNTGPLKVGEYSRCKIASAKLTEYYNEVK